MHWLAGLEARLGPAGPQPRLRPARRSQRRAPARPGQDLGLQESAGPPRASGLHLRRQSELDRAHQALRPGPLRLPLRAVGTDGVGSSRPGSSRAPPRSCLAGTSTRSSRWRRAGPCRAVCGRETRIGAPGGASKRQRGGCKSLALPSEVRILPPPSELRRREPAGVGRTRISSNHQLTVPRAPFEQAELEVGDGFRVEAVGPGQLTLTRLSEFAAAHEAQLRLGTR